MRLDRLCKTQRSSLSVFGRRYLSTYRYIPRDLLFSKAGVPLRTLLNPSNYRSLQPECCFRGDISSLACVLEGFSELNGTEPPVKTLLRKKVKDLSKRRRREACKGSFLKRRFFERGGQGQSRRASRHAVRRSAISPPRPNRKMPLVM